MKDIVLLDLFSGIGGFSKGLSDAGFNIVKHYFSEIDKHAIAVYKHQFKNSEYVGSVTALDGRAITRPNIITFGSPCQDFSVAGKRAGMAGQRSSLIGEAIRLIAECKPDIFIWENVKGVFSSNDGEDFWAVVQAFTNIGGYRLEWQLLNTAWFLPQNRERIYLIGHLAKSGRDFKGVFPIGEGDSGIADEQRERINIVGQTNGGQHRMVHGDGLMSCLTSTDYKQPKQIIAQNRERDIQVIGNVGKGHEVDNVHDENGIAPTFRENHGKITIVAQRGRGENNEQQLEERQDGVTNTLTGVQKDNLLVIGNIYKSNGQNGNVYDPDGISPALSSGETNTPGNGGIGSSNAPKIMIGDYRADEGLRIRTNNNCPTILAGSGQPVIKIEEITQKPARWSRSEKGKESRREAKKQGKDYTPFSDGNRELNPTDDENIGCITGATNKDSLLFVERKKHQQDEINDPEKNAQCLVVGCHGNSDHFTKTKVNNTIRRLTEIECERLQGFPESELFINFNIWRNCTDHQKHHVPNVEEKCHKLQKFVGNVENDKLKVAVLCAERNFIQKNLSINRPVLSNVHIHFGVSTVEIHSQEKLLLSAKIAESKNWFHPHIRIDDFVLLLVRMNLIQEKETEIGKEELHQREQILIRQRNLEMLERLCGKEMTQPANDAKTDLIILNQLLKYTTSYHLNTSQGGLILRIWFSYVFAVIIGFIPKEIQIESLSEISLSINNGWTEYGDYDGKILKIAKTQRYKMLGNAVTVAVVREIGKRLLNN